MSNGEFENIDKWIAGENIPFPDLVILLAKASKEGNVQILRSVLSHLESMELDAFGKPGPALGNWFLHAMTIVRGLTNNCDDATIESISDGLLHIRDTVIEYKSHTDYNPLRYTMRDNPLNTIIEDIDRRFPNG